MAPSTSSSDVARVSAHFPRVPPGCEKVAESFFQCFYEHGKQSTGTHDPDAGNRGLAHCATAMAAYNACVDAVATKAPRKLFRVPEAYRMREEQQ